SRSARLGCIDHRRYSMKLQDHLLRRSFARTPRPDRDTSRAELRRQVAAEKSEALAQPLSHRRTFQGTASEARAGPRDAKNLASSLHTARGIFYRPDHPRRSKERT